MIDKNERVEDLQYKGLKIIQDKTAYCFSSDAVMLANFAKIKRGEIVGDFCAGSGIISIIINAKNNPKKIICVEIQEKMSKICEKNIILNNFSNNIELINNSLQDYCQKSEPDLFDVIVCNPPYKKCGTSFYNENEIVAISRHEIKLDLKTLCQNVKRVLKFGKRFYISYDANRSAELLFELKRNSLEPKRIFFTQSGENSNANLIFVEAVKGGKEGVEVLPVMITNDKDGNYVQNIIDNYKRK